MESKPALERIGRAANRYRWLVVATWLLVAAGFGVFAPSLDHALSGAGWQVTGSDSLAARDQIDARFGGMSSQSAVVVVRSDTVSTSDPAFRAAINNAQAILATSAAFHTPAVEQVSQDGRTVMLQAGAATNPDGVTRAAEDLSPKLSKLSGPRITVSMTGSPAFWGDFNNVTRSGMVRAETLSWPLTAIVLVIAFGSLAAAGLPLLLTLAGLLTTMGILYTITRFTDLSIWSLNFAMMFALALGIDYALFIVTRYRAALHAHPDDSRTAVGIAMNTAGKAVLFSGLTVLVSLSAVLIVPIPAFRTIAIGMILAVTLVLLAALTLLPAVLGPVVNRLALPWHHVGEHRSHRWESFARRVQRSPVLIGGVALIILGAASFPLLGIKTGMPSIKVLPESAAARQGYDAIASAFGTGAPGPIQIVVPPSADAAAIASDIRQVRGVAVVFPPQSGADGYVLLTAIATTDPSSSASRDVVDAIRAASPAGVLVGGPVAENHDLANSLAHNTPIVIGTVMVLGFLLLLAALRGLVIAAAGVLLNLLSVAAAFGVGVLAFQHGWLAGPLGFESQGYLTAWAPLFFFALVFALSMDYTVFLLASAREHFEISGNPDEAVRGAIAHSAQPIVAAAAVMVVVFFTFAISGPLPVKEMGIILGVAVFLDALLVRLIVVPALLRLLGHAAWWTPGWVDRLLPEVRFAH
jgi:RND superfamily putative drug exporter